MTVGFDDCHRLSSVVYRLFVGQRAGRLRCHFAFKAQSRMYHPAQKAPRMPAGSHIRLGARINIVRWVYEADAISFRRAFWR